MSERPGVVEVAFAELKRLREGEEPGYAVPEAEPTPGQWYRRLHEVPAGHRLEMIERMFSLARSELQSRLELSDQLKRIEDLEAVGRRQASVIDSLVDYVKVLHRDPERFMSQEAVADEISAILSQ
ncbi:hypothetical protein [Streptomyces cucumeris]|uniref:hypothetical protein n=1 Tax=Streptomyces cucumeris TaxID=2962890 RepID=UPI0020C8E487|nr:hypothetical protein [Streptomyces sp. NEAU-Y11]MCP9209729.1 hypothetical protein [Streptomyces sp. NEAU-Y11]